MPSKMQKTPLLKNKLMPFLLFVLSFNLGVNAQNNIDSSRFNLAIDDVISNYLCYNIANFILVFTNVAIPRNSNFTRMHYIIDGYRPYYSISRLDSYEKFLDHKYYFYCMRISPDKFTDQQGNLKYMIDNSHNPLIYDSLFFIVDKHMHDDYLGVSGKFYHGKIDPIIFKGWPNRWSADELKNFFAIKYMILDSEDIQVEIPLNSVFCFVHIVKDSKNIKFKVDKNKSIKFNKLIYEELK